MTQNLYEKYEYEGGLLGWEQDLDRTFMKKNYKFATFEECQQFVLKVGVFADSIDHHPEWTLSDDGKTVDVKLTTHSAGNRVTLMDYKLAEKMNEINS